MKLTPLLSIQVFNIYTPSIITGRTVGCIQKFNSSPTHFTGRAVFLTT